MKLSVHDLYDRFAPLAIFVCISEKIVSMRKAVNATYSLGTSYSCMRPIGPAWLLSLYLGNGTLLLCLHTESYMNTS